MDTAPAAIPSILFGSCGAFTGEINIRKARAYNEEMLGNIELLDPFSTKKKEVNERYESILNVNGSGMMGYV